MKREYPRKLILLLVFMSVSLQGQASDITPSHVYQKTELLRVILLKQDLLDTHLYESIKGDDSLRHPRHVMQKVRKCHTIFSKILRGKDIESSPIPELFSVREIRPSDVENGVSHLIAEISKLGHKDVTEPKFVPGKVPNDVYNNLKRICRAVRAEIVPSDVYQAAVAVNENLDKIAGARGYEIAETYGKFQNKIPRDVYRETVEFLEDLRLLALNPDFAIPGGVLIPNIVPSGEIRPDDVLTVMNESLAETDAIKYSLNIREHMTLPEYEEGKTPSDVFSQIDRAHSLVRFLLEKEGLE